MLMLISTRKKVTMLTQYDTAPKFKTVDFTGLRGGSKPAGTSEKKSDSSSKDENASPKTGDSRVPVAAGAAAVAAAAAAVAFVTKKKN